VVDHELRDHPDATLVGLAEKPPKVRHRAVVGIDVEIIGDVVAVVQQRRGIEGQQPQGRHAQLLDVVGAEQPSKSPILSPVLP
jgi:hypothetical protein